MSQSLEERIARLADTLDSESKVRVRDTRPVALAAPTRHRPRVTLVAAAVASVLVLALATWLLTTRGDDASVTTNSVAGQPTTTSVVTGEPDLQTVTLTPDQQVDWLTRHAQSQASVHIPGWRIELSAERVECDYAGVPNVSIDNISGSASEFPLGEAITADRIIQECGNGTDATRAAGVDLTSQGTLCKSVSTKRVAPAGAAEPTDVVVTEPAVIFTGGSCEASGYETPAPDFVDSIEEQRRAEILLRAVPRACPTADETRAWVARQVKTLPEHWTISIGPVTGCALPTVDWWSHTVSAP